MSKFVADLLSSPNAFIGDPEVLDARLKRSGMTHTKCIAITMGDPRGIGPEVITKALQQRNILSLGKFVVIGSRKLLRNIKAAVIDISYRTPGEGSLKFLDKGIQLIKEKIADALVTAPLSKETVSGYHKNFLGHTEYLANSFYVKRFAMMFVSPQVRLLLVTRHVALNKVSKLITKGAVFSSIGLMQETLQQRFGLSRPRIAVLGLNPHAGEKGLLGTEEIKYIIPAIHQAKRQGIKVEGPFPADTFFIQWGQLHNCPPLFDGIVAMYHDQGLAPMKGMYFKELVNFTAGLPFVRTSPVHGTAFDIAGRGLADPSSMIAAIKLAFELA